MIRHPSLIILAALPTGAAAEPTRPADTRIPENPTMTTPDVSSAKRTAEITLVINAPADAVWKALTDADEIVQWFPLEARVKPGVGGSIFTSWKNEHQWESPITIWEPNKQLRVLWCPLETPEPDLFGVDYFLQSRNDGATILRLVHFGFGSEPQWDEMYDGVSRGWDHMTWCLKEYLEKHPGEKRSVVYVGANISETDCERVWNRFFSKDGLFPDASLMNANPGQTFSIRMTTGDELAGTVRRLVKGKDFSAKIDSPADATLNVQVHRCHADVGFKLQVTLSAFGLEPARFAAMEKSWQEAIDRAAKRQ